METSQRRLANHQSGDKSNPRKSEGKGTLKSTADPLKKQGRAHNLEKGDDKWLLGNTEVKLKRICNVDVRQKATYKGCAEEPRSY